MKIETKVYDNAVPESIVEKIEEIIGGHNMDWYFNDTTSEKEEGKYDTPQMVHEMYGDGEILSSILDVVAPLITMSGLPVAELYRVKANMLFNFGNTSGHNPYHKDASEDYYTLLYYVNDSDGDTVIKTMDGYDKVRVEPKRGRFVIFESSLEHHSTPPTKGRRMVINIIIRKEPRAEDVKDLK